MPICTFCGVELVPAQNGLFLCEKCGTYFETVKQDAPPPPPAETRFVVTKFFKIFGTKKTVVSGFVQGTTPLALPGRAHLQSAYNGYVQEVTVSSFRAPQTADQTYSLIIEGLPSGAISAGDIITTANITPQQNYGNVYTPNAAPTPQTYAPPVPPAPPTSAPPPYTPQPTYTPPPTYAPPVVDEIKQAEQSHLIYLFGMKMIEVYGSREFYNTARECNLEGIDFDVNAEGFSYKMFTKDWKIISEEPCHEFSKLKAVNREEWGAEMIDKEPDRVDNPKARKAMLKVLMTDYISKIPFFDVDVKIARATFNGKPF